MPLAQGQNPGHLPAGAAPDSGFQATLAIPELVANASTRVRCLAIVTAEFAAPEPDVTVVPSRFHG